MSNEKLSAKRAVQIIKSRMVINEAGKYILQAVNVNDVSDKDIKRGETKLSHIANFKGATPYHIAKAKEALREGDTNTAANQQLSFGILEGGYVPQPGEECICQVKEIELKDGSTGLFITSVLPQPTKTASKKVDLGEEFDAMLEEADAEEGDEA